MKICDKCGAYNSDDRKFCVDCSSLLPEKLTETQEHRTREKISDKIDEMYNKKDPLYVSRFDKTVGGISVVGAIASLVLLIVNIVAHKNVDMLLIAIIFFVISAIDALVPRIMWFFERSRLIFTANGTDELIPSDYYLKRRRVAIVLSAVIGLFLLVRSMLI